MKREWMTKLRTDKGLTLSEAAVASSDKWTTVRTCVLEDLESSDKMFTGRYFAHKIAKAYGMTREQELSIGKTVNLDMEDNPQKKHSNAGIRKSVQTARVDAGKVKAILKRIEESTGRTAKSISLAAGKQENYMAKLVRRIEREPVTTLSGAQRTAKLLGVTVKEILADES